MVTAISRPTSGPVERILGPACRFRLQGRSLQFGPKNDLLAEYRDGKWNYDGRTYSILESEAPTLLEFNDADAWRPNLRGPFAALQIKDGVIRFGPRFEKILAAFDEEAEAWCVFPEQKNYREVLLTPAKPGWEEDATHAESQAKRTKVAGHSG